MRIDKKEYLYKQIVETTPETPHFLSFLFHLSMNYFEDYPDITCDIKKRFLDFRCMFYNEEQIPSLENIERQIKSMAYQGKNYLRVRNNYGNYKYHIVDIEMRVIELRNFILDCLKLVPIRFTATGGGVMY